MGHGVWNDGSPSQALLLPSTEAGHSSNPGLVGEETEALRA